MSEISTSGPIDVSFLTENEIHTSYEEMPSRGFNRLVKAIRQGRWFILKGLKAELRDQVVYQELLRKEYALMVQLDHPNIVKAYAKEVNGMLGPCIVMEYVDGVTLDVFLEGKPTKDARLKVLDQLADALGYIHSKQILHRDLKPSNILITRNGGNVKVIDFGLSDADDYVVFKQSAGTVRYMSPEQASGAAVDCRSDIYSFGLLLKEIFPHRYPRIALKCSRKDPGRRFGSMEEVRKALESSRMRRRMVPSLCMGALLALALAFPFRRGFNTGLDSDSLAEDITVPQTDYLRGAFWHYVVDTDKLINEAEEGKTYREILASRLNKLDLYWRSRYSMMANLYDPESPEHLYFITQTAREQDKNNSHVVKTIGQYCPSFEQDFSHGRINRHVYDSLNWVVSPGVVTLPVADISATSASGGAGLMETAFAGDARLGICWSPCRNPTTDCRHAEADNPGVGRVVMSGLAPGSTYFVRSYVKTGAGTTYGDEISFTTPDSVLVVPTGAVRGLFTVGPGRQVFFSRGNLQYRASTGTWRFAERQFDSVGEDNMNISSTYDGWIDLFGWGTSGYDHGAVEYQPWSGNPDTGTNSLHYAYGNPDSDLYDNDGRADWGYNRIENGGDKENLWRTPSVSELICLLFNRTTVSGVRFAKAKVAGVNGLLILPDNWKVAGYPLNSVNDPSSDYSLNIIPVGDWERILEPAGAVFLPEAGARSMNGFISWFSAYYTSNATGDDAWHIIFDGTLLQFDCRGHRGDGLSVRLVRDAGENPVL